jgi:hypothetical protein
MTTYAARVTDATPASLEYGDYQGWVEINGETGEWLRDLTDEERDGLDLGGRLYSSEYADLRPIHYTEQEGVA